MPSKINYNDKVQLVNDETIPDENKVKAEDMNQIKQVVNNNADELGTKQPKESGKGLSTNDFTDEYIQQIENNTEDIGSLETATENQGRDITNIKSEQTTQSSQIEDLQAELAQTKRDLNNSIDIIKLDDTLQGNYTKEYSKINLEFENTGLPTGSVGEDITISEQSAYKYTIIDLIKDNVYCFNGFNYFSSTALFIYDTSTNKIIYKSYRGVSGLDPFNIVYRPNKENLVAYIVTLNTITSILTYFVNKGTTLSYISNTKNMIRNRELNIVNTISDGYPARQSTLNNIPVIKQNEGYNTKIYKLSKGTHYKVTSYNYLAIIGLIITNENFETIYMSTTEAVNPRTIFNYDFVSTDDGYALIPEYTGSGSWNGEISIIDDYLSVIDEHLAEYRNKKWVAVGDSLTDPSTLGQGVKNYVDYVSEKLSLQSYNMGVGGTGYWRGHSRNKSFYTRVQSIPTDADLITIFGSFNDLGLEDGVYGSSVLGEPTDTGTDTVCGCINTTLDNIYTRCPDAVIGIIMPTPWSNFYGTNVNANNYIDKLKEICKIRSIPCLDLFSGSNMYPWIESFRDTYYKGDGDGVHPNTNGHKRFSAQIKEFIKSILY